MPIYPCLARVAIEQTKSKFKTKLVGSGRTHWTQCLFLHIQTKHKSNSTKTKQKWNASAKVMCITTT